MLHQPLVTRMKNYQDVAGFLYTVELYMLKG